MNELMLFQKEEFGQVRVVERNGEPWFVAKDVCECLELTNASQTLSYLDDDERDIISNDTPGGKQNMLIVSEPGLYSLVLRSRKPEAKAFKRWIVHEVLPAITTALSKRCTNCVGGWIKSIRFSKTVVHGTTPAVVRITWLATFTNTDTR